MSEYKVKFEVFEGPLDLLLYLIKKDEVDIYEVNLTQIATQFIEYIDVMRMLDLEIAGEFLVMAATLMYIKSKELLPVDQRPEAEEEEGEDPRWELIRQLVEYKKFKDAASQLQQLEARQEDIYPRVPGILKFEAEEPREARPQASLFDLINAVNAVMKRLAGRDEAREIYDDKWTVSEKIESLLRELSEKATLKFSEIFARAESRTEVVVTFLALLELIRLRQLSAIQGEAFGEIEIARASPPPDPAAEPRAEVESQSPEAAAPPAAAGNA
ncbi:MAG: segregation/condensation protein A [Verrucomicrobia bacterium]|nr:segregation/condensation protein A [Verrucomicrobiota bacterium]MBI3867048.1 segregation/condensation protein A [Verrucomicrobiota bacterium]